MYYPRDFPPKIPFFEEKLEIKPKVDLDLDLGYCNQFRWNQGGQICQKKFLDEVSILYTAWDIYFWAARSQKLAHFGMKMSDFLAPKIHF